MAHRHEATPRARRALPARLPPGARRVRRTAAPRAVAVLGGRGRGSGGRGPPDAAVRRWRGRVGRLPEAHRPDDGSHLPRDGERPGARTGRTRRPDAGAGGRHHLRPLVAVQKERATVARLASADAAEGSRLDIRRADGEPLTATLDVRLVPGKTTAVELECVDGEVYVHVDGEEIVHLDEARSIDDIRDLEDFEQELRLTAAGGAVVVRDLRIERDVYYRRGTCRALAQRNRRVRARGALLHARRQHGPLERQPGLEPGRRRARGRHGDLVRGERNRQLAAHRRRRLPHVVDREGIERRWRARRTRSPSRPTPATRPSSTANLVVGRAFFIFWPVCPGFPGRAGFIH